MPTYVRLAPRLSLGLILCMAAATGPVSAQNLSETVQSGSENSATILQDGRNFSFTLQIGTENAALIEQAGRHNLSAVAQSGEGHEMTVTQTGDRAIHASTQADTRLGPVERSRSGTTAGITTRFEFRFD